MKSSFYQYTARKEQQFGLKEYARLRTKLNFCKICHQRAWDNLHMTSALRGILTKGGEVA